MNQIKSNENFDSQDHVLTIFETMQKSKTPVAKYFITPVLVAALDRCQLSMRDSVFIFSTTIEALGFNVDELPISKSTIQRIRTEKQNERAEAIKTDLRKTFACVKCLETKGRMSSYSYFLRT